MAPKPGQEPGLPGAADDHAPRVLAGHPVAGQLLAAAAAKRTEEGSGLLQAPAARFGLSAGARSASRVPKRGAGAERSSEMDGRVTSELTIFVNYIIKGGTLTNSYGLN